MPSLNDSHFLCTDTQLTTSRTIAEPAVVGTNPTYNNRREMANIFVSHNDDHDRLADCREAYQVVNAGGSHQVKQIYLPG